MPPAECQRNIAALNHEDTKSLRDSTNKASQPRSREEALAMEIAHAFHDMDGIALYVDYCRRYPEPIIRRAYGEVKELPDSAIRRSRGALFNYLVQKYAKGEDEETPGI